MPHKDRNNAYPVKSSHISRLKQLQGGIHMQRKKIGQRSIDQMVSVVQVRDISEGRGDKKDHTEQ